MTDSALAEWHNAIGFHSRRAPDIGASARGSQQHDTPIHHHSSGELPAAPARALAILAALAACWFGAAHLASRFAWHTPSPDLQAQPPVPLPEGREPVLSPAARDRIRSPEARELIDSLLVPAAVARRIRVGLFSEKSCCDAPEPLARILEAIPLCTWQPITAAEIHADGVE